MLIFVAILWKQSTVRTIDTDPMMRTIIGTWGRNEFRLFNTGCVTSSTCNGTIDVCKTLPYRLTPTTQNSKVISIF